MIELLPFILNIATTYYEPNQVNWLRKTETESLVSLELASRRYASEGKPDLWVICVTDIAEEKFYTKVASLLEDLDVVLYESVRPTGAKPPSNVDDTIAVQSTKASMEFVADICKQTAEEIEEIPSTLDALIADSALLDRRFSGWVDDASVDAWGRPFALQIHKNQKSFSIWSFGSDGKAGGDSTAKDLQVTRTVDFVNPFADGVVQDADKSSLMQENLIASLNLELQFDALPYEEPNWFCSDLTVGEIREKLIQRNADASLVDSLTGESRVLQLAINMTKLMPNLKETANAKMQNEAKLLLIELLAATSIEDMSSSINPGLMKVITVDRNTELLEDIAATINLIDDIKTIGILYGVEHMEDFDHRLGELFNYEPAEEVWIGSISVSNENNQESTASE